MKGDASFRAAGEGREPIANEEILEDLKIPFDDLRRDRTVPGDRGHVEHRALRKGSRFQESTESGDVPGQTLLLNFFPEPGSDVALQERLRIGDRARVRQAAPVQAPREVEIAGELPGREWVHVMGEGAAGEKVDAPAAELPGTRARQREADAPGFDEAMDLVEKDGGALDFVDDDPVVV